MCHLNSSIVQNWQIVFWSFVALESKNNLLSSLRIMCKSDTELVEHPKLTTGLHGDKSTIAPTIHVQDFSACQGRVMERKRRIKNCCCCSTVLHRCHPILWWIYIKKAAHYLKCLAPLSESRTREDIDHRPCRHLQKNQPVSLDHKEYLKCFFLLLLFVCVWLCLKCINSKKINKNTPKKQELNTLICFMSYLLTFHLSHKTHCALVKRPPQQASVKMCAGSNCPDTEAKPNEHFIRETILVFFI